MPRGGKMPMPVAKPGKVSMGTGKSGFQAKASAPAAAVKGAKIPPLSAPTGGPAAREKRLTGKKL